MTHPHQTTSKTSDAAQQTPPPTHQPATYKMPPRVLLIGGHGKISLLMTPLLLSRSWTVISLFRDPSQTDEIRALGHGQSGKLDVLVRSLEDVKSSQQAKTIIEEAKPDYVVWSAGAGGVGGPSRTYAIDRDAAKCFIAAAVAVPSVKKFLMISYIGSRRKRAPWWTDEDWASCQKVNTEVLPDYFKAKVDADECLTALGKRREDFNAIVLRPGTLTDGKKTGRVKLGKTGASGSVSRSDVADVAVRLLEREGANGWYDLLEGNEEAGGAVERVIREKVDCLEGEDLDDMLSRFTE
ncbi:hypothetical protein MMC13_004082 [Lambiella insularis]|nr:hypothetical protein [Lambiella insularis]